MSTSRKWTTKEIGLMVVPCLALAIMGWNLRDRRGAPLSTTPANTVTIDDIKLEPATPLDVSQGYDTRLTVKYSPAPLPARFGNPTINSRLETGPFNPRITYQKNGIERSFGAPGKNFQTQVGGYQHTYLLRLHQVPTNLGRLTLKAAITTGYFYPVTLKNGKSTSTTWYAPPLPIAVVVRKVGETVRLPVVSRRCPLRVKNVKVEQETLLSSRTSASSTQTRVAVTMESLDPKTEKFSDKCGLVNPRLVDGSGKVVRTGAWLQPFAEGSAGQRIAVRGYNFNSKLIAANIPKVILKAEASVNDCWPLPISIVVRDNTKAVVKVAAKQ